MKNWDDILKGFILMILSISSLILSVMVTNLRKEVSMLQEKVNNLEILNK